MTFTDDDLKVLKEWANDLSDKTVPDRREIVPLLARLEAAEKVIEAHCRLEQEKISYDNFVSLLNQWRRIVGNEK